MRIGGMKVLEKQEKHQSSNKQNIDVYGWQTSVLNVWKHDVLKLVHEQA